MARILIVDEGSINRRFVAVLLRSHGHQIFEASGADEALDLVRAKRPDLALVDVLMPRLEGCRFVLGLGVDASVRGTRVILRVPDHIAAQARALAQALGVELALKPASPELLLALVNSSLSGPARRPAPAEDEERALESFVRETVYALQQHASDTERQRAQLERRVASYDARLELTRSALDEEIRKRLLAELELNQANSKLHYNAMRDELTGLYNRRYLNESLKREVSRSRRTGRPFAVMMIDVDDFKRFNDTLGHAAGDAVLRAIGEYLTSSSRGEDIVCRYGGDEFVLLMTQASQITMRERAEVLCLGARSLQVELEGHSVGPVNVSAGVGIFPDHGDSSEQIVQAADAALLRSKRFGRGRVAIGGRAIG